MGAVKDALEAVREVILLNAEVKRLTETIKNHSIDLRDLDHRLVRIETMIELTGRGNRQKKIDAN